MRKSHNYARLDEIRKGLEMPLPENDWFFGDKNDDFEKTVKRGAGVFIALWVLSALASLGVTAVVIWAIVQLVQWVTAK